MNNGKGQLTPELLTQFRNYFSSDPHNKVALNAVTRGNVQDIALNRDVLNDIDFSFSHEIETADVTDQKKSGTCWLYADLNWLRTFTTKKAKIKSIEFSENYLIFYDKLEKANHFLENMIELADRDRDDRTVNYLLHEPLPDGGEWHMMVNLIKKYGLIPVSVMPETFNRENSRFLNELTSYKLREGAAKIRNAFRNGSTPEAMYQIKNDVMNDVYRIVSICLGNPPASFNWSYKDDDKKFNREIGITPHQFYEKFVGVDLDETYTLWSCPAAETPFYKTFTVDRFNNMVGGKQWHCLNLPIPELKKLAIESLKNGEACLFGCDVLQHSNTKEGILYPNVYDYDLLFKTTFNMDKATRFEYGQSRLTHSMVFIGVDIIDEKPVKWKIENSWGDKVGKKGHFIMSDAWFDEHVFDLIVQKKYLTPEMTELFKQDPIVLPPWYPMT